jgi:hypothetical protein
MTTPQLARSALLAALLLASPLALAGEPAPAGPGAASGASAPEAPASPGPRACASSAECAARLGYGSVCLDGQCGPYLDDTDLLEWINLKKKRKTVEAWRLYPSIIPAVGYTPQNGFVLGITTLAGIYLGDPETTTISSLALVAFVTTKSQLIVQSRNVAMLEGNAWQLQGDYRLLLTNQSTYGLGSTTEAGDRALSIGGGGPTATLAGEQPMDFNLFRLHQTVLRRLGGPWYAGLSLRFDRYYDIVDRRLDLGAVPPVVTSHEAYAQQFRFPTGAYNLSGVGLEALYDSRDSTINAYRGALVHAALRAYPTELGSTRDSSLAYGEARAYVGLDGGVPRNVLAFWLIAQGVTSGAQPYLALPAITWDFGVRSGRGYVQGRFRGDAEVYAEAEWRFRLTASGMVGGVVFANASTFSRPAVDVVGYQEGREALFTRIRPAGGAGLRFMMNREARNNVTLDVGVGQDSVGIYFGAGEAF